MEGQNIPKKHRDLLLKIARCNVADKVLDLLISGMNEDEILEKLRNERGKGNERQSDDAVCIDNCIKICSYQKKLLKGSDSKQEFSKSMFHVPEPWSGNLKTAEVLFVGSNPTIDLKEKFPKFESEKWPDYKVVDFFSNRLNNLENLKSKYWTWILKFAGCILGEIESVRAFKKNEEDKKRKIASRIALTEILHCKSKGEKEGKVSEAAKTCFALPKDEDGDTNTEDNYTTAVIKYFLEPPETPSDSETKKSGTKKTVVFLGEIARERIYALAEKKKFNIKGEPISSFCKSEFGCQEARFSSCPIRAKGACPIKSVKNVSTNKNVSIKSRQSEARLRPVIEYRLAIILAPRQQY